MTRRIARGSPGGEGGGGGQRNVRRGRQCSIGTTAVLNAAPEGYTLLASAFNHIILNHAVKGVTFDPQTDFETIGRTARHPAMSAPALDRDSPYRGTAPALTTYGRACALLIDASSR